MKEDDERKNAAEEITIIEDKSKLSSAAEPEDRDDEEDDRPKAQAGEPDSDGDTDDEREAIRERRRLEKVDRKERRDKAISRDKVEMEFLRKRNDELERRMGAQEQRAFQTDLSSFDAQIAKAQQEAEMAERVIAKAVEAGNGADVTQAMRYRDQALQKAQHLGFAKHNVAQKAPQQKAPGIDDRTMRHAQEFLGENTWYDPQGRDEDSAIVLAIDQGMVRDGYNPQSEDYWDELRLRAARRLPERFGKAAAPRREPADGREERAPRGGPAISSGREHAPATSRREVYISPERKQALVEAGVWDDPALRQRYVKRYAEYDKNNRA
jgi:hypothetical protein